jgi:hypothetical protein
MAAVLAPIQERFRAIGQQLAEDPVAWLTRTLLKLGTALLIAGLALGTIGYFLKASATAAANNEKAVIGNIGTIFSNIKAPSFSPSATGTAPLSFSLQGVQNFFSDAWRDVQGAASDVAQIGSVLGTLAEDVGAGLADLAKAFVAFVLHFPDILWNGLVWGVGGAIADLMNWVFPWFVILGAALLVAGLVIHGIRILWDRTIGDAWKSSAGKWLERRRQGAERLFDRVFHNRPEAPPLGVPVAPPPAVPFLEELPEPPAPAPNLPLALNVPPAGGRPEGEVQPGSTFSPPETTIPTPPEPAADVQAVPPADRPLQEPPRKHELERTLGEGYTEAKDRMRAALRTGELPPPPAT